MIKGNFVIVTRLLILVASLCLCSTVTAELSSFPGAEGFGSIATGGRGGQVLRVRNLQNSGPGSLQEALNQKGPRIIVFEVSGVIRGDLYIRHSNVTIAGQSAPNPGITVEGSLFGKSDENYRLQNIVIRFLRFRPKQVLGFGGDVVQLPYTRRVMLDHLSLAWGSDEMVDIIHSSDISLQWCTIEESDTSGHSKGAGHNYAILSAYAGSGNISIHHNLFAHHSRRLPSLSPYERGKPGDFRNNVVYNFKEGMGHDGHIPRAAINLVSNYYKRGPSAWRVIPFSYIDRGTYFVSGNFLEGIGNIDNSAGVSLIKRFVFRPNARGRRLDREAPVEKVFTDSAQTAMQRVLRRAGTFPRDRVTRRTVAEFRNGTGKWGRDAPVELSDSWFFVEMPSEAPTLDTDGDFLPDRWENQNQLDKSDPNDSRITMPSGYDALEQYLNERANFLIESGQY